MKSPLSVFVAAAIISGIAASQESYAAEKAKVETEKSKNSCKGKDAEKEKVSSDGKSSCKGKAQPKAKNNCSGKNGCDGEE